MIIHQIEKIAKRKIDPDQLDLYLLEPVLKLNFTFCQNVWVCAEHNQLFEMGGAMDHGGG